MSAHIGSQYEGEVVAVTNFGMFVRIPEFHIDGLVHVTSLGQDYFHFDRATQSLVGESSGVVFQLGDKVKIEVANVDLEDRKIDFELIEFSSNKVTRKRSEREKLYLRAKKDKVASERAGRRGSGRKDSNKKSVSDAKKQPNGKSRKSSKKSKKNPKTTQKTGSRKKTKKSKLKK
jgi:ribonuclease R